MKFYLSCVAAFLLVATVSTRHAPGHPRPTTFGSKYVVYGDTKDKTCDQAGCRFTSYQFQYYQNLAKRTPIRINTNVRKVYENIFYQRSVFSNRFHEYILDVSTNKCKARSYPILPILNVPASFTYQGQAQVEGKLCEVWRSTTGRPSPIAIETWYVYYNIHVSPPRYEPARYMFSFNANSPGSSSPQLSYVTNYRGYNTAVADSTFDLPSQC